MDADDFWRIVASARSAVGDRADDRDTPEDPLPEALRDALTPLGPERIVAFMVEACRLTDRAYTYALWGAAYLIEGGRSDDGFMNFRDGLVLQGREVFERAVADPDSLALLPLVQSMARGNGGWLGYESLSHLVQVAFTLAGGGDASAFNDALAEALKPRPLELSGADWDLDDDEATRDRLPRLHALGVTSRHGAPP